MEEKKLTDEQVVKALEWCGTSITCKGCPKYGGETVIDYRNCKRGLLEQSIDLIRRLQYGYSSASKASEEWREKYEKERKENAELTDEKEDLYFQNQNLQTYIDNHEPIWKRNTEQAVKDTAKEILDEASKHFGGKWLVELYKKYGLEWSVEVE